MPIKIPSNLPAFNVLKNEGVMVMDDFKAKRQDIRPLKIGLLNLMPKKIQTEKKGVFNFFNCFTPPLMFLGMLFGKYLNFRIYSYHQL